MYKCIYKKYYDFDYHNNGMGIASVTEEFSICDEHKCPCFHNADSPWCSYENGRVLHLKRIGD